MKRLLLYGLLATAAIACKKQEHTVAVQQLTFGTFHGMCPGGCNYEYVLNGTTLQRADSVTYDATTGGYTYKSLTQLSTDKYALSKDLLTTVPEQLTTNTSKTYGAPDTHDQGGVYIELNAGGATRRFRIDMDNTNDQSITLQTFKQRVNDITEQVRK
jgi:hypothetical protein